MSRRRCRLPLRRKRRLSRRLCRLPLRRKIPLSRRCCICLGLHLLGNGTDLDHHRKCKIARTNRTRNPSEQPDMSIEMLNSICKRETPDETLDGTMKMCDDHDLAPLNVALEAHDQRSFEVAHILRPSQLSVHVILECLLFTKI